RIFPLSLHDALPISVVLAHVEMRQAHGRIVESVDSELEMSGVQPGRQIGDVGAVLEEIGVGGIGGVARPGQRSRRAADGMAEGRSEGHTSELQSLTN